MQNRLNSLPSEPRTFFKHGPSPTARLTFFGLLSVALMFIDARFNTLETLRKAIATVVYPVQQAALVPSQLYGEVAELFRSRADLREENAHLKAELLAASSARQAQVAAAQETERLSRLLELAQSTPTTTQASRIVYVGRDPFSQKVFISRQSGQTFETGAAVIDDLGLLGQLTRVHPQFAELTLLTEKDFAIPVKVERNGMRALIYGRGPGKQPEVRYVANNADLREGDVLLTSGIDGLYPPNLRVAAIAAVTRDPESAFLRIDATPYANMEGSEVVLVLSKPEPLPTRPPTPPTTARPSQRGR